MFRILAAALCFAGLTAHAQSAPTDSITMLGHNNKGLACSVVFATNHEMGGVPGTFNEPIRFTVERDQDVKTGEIFWTRYTFISIATIDFGDGVTDYTKQLKYNTTGNEKPTGVLNFFQWLPSNVANRIEDGRMIQTTRESSLTTDMHGRPMGISESATEYTYKKELCDVCAPRDERCDCDDDGTRWARTSDPARVILQDTCTLN